MLIKSTSIWRDIQKTNFSNLDELASFLELSLEQKNKLINRSNFPLNLPRRLAEKIEKKTLDDPILKQFVGFNNELEVSEGFCMSPTQDESFSKTSKLLQKYNKRALLITTSACAMNCRFCFRQNYPYDVSKKAFSEEISLIASDPSLIEIILSGGDPLSLSDRALSDLICSLEQISHIKIVRFHTRFPIGIPERISEDFLKIFEHRRLKFIFVVHINHPKEIDDDVSSRLKVLQSLGIPILNHTVLLKDINDNLETMLELNTRLVLSGIIPYYLNQLDKVQGSSHFEVAFEKGKLLIEEMRKHLPGYAIPRYIQEIPGKPHKTILL
jgi:EF-P beta-lysylation protein EpmB